MAQVNLSALVGRLDETCKRSLEAAAGLCLSRTHYNVEIEHWLSKLIEMPGNDISRILERYEIDPASLQRDVTRALDVFKTGNSRAPAIAPSVVDLAREAWLVASLDHGQGVARSGHLLIAMLADETLARQAYDISRLFEKIPEATLRKDFGAITAKSNENVEATARSSAATPGVPAGPKVGGSLDQFTIDLTARAKAGQIDPVLGRESEIRQVIDILLRRRQNNPILTGEAGVGKTAVAEGFALAIARGDVPKILAGVRVLSLDLSLLQAGAGVKGEFENRLKSVIQEVKSSPQPIILFIDEAHMLIGAGGSAGQGDAASLLKPALARGELRTIAATTWAEYKKYFERDAALARRFQVVKVEEPDEETAVQIMRGLVEVMESHHKVRVLDEAVIDSVRLSKRYLSGRQLPDKSVSLLDTACARVALSQSSTPAALEDCTRRISQLATTLSMLNREEAASGTQAERIDKFNKEKLAAEAEGQALAKRWGEEKVLVARMRELRSKLESEFAEPIDGKPAEKLADLAKKGLRTDLDQTSKQLRTLQGEAPLIHPFVDAQAVAEVLANWTGIPVGRMVADQIKSVLTLKEQMMERIVGQDSALAAIAQAIRTSRAGLTDPVKPIGVFMLVGTSGVGKTETAITLAELLYGGEQNMTTINMSEFKEEHKVSLLMGSPPGYVGYGEGGVLTEAVRRKPYSVVLLDELEKAHPGVQDIFYQVFDKGRMKDGEGRDIDFRNTVILMTTNAGTDTIMSLWADQSTMPDAQGLGEALKPELLKWFKPAFIGRCTVLPFFPLSPEVMKGIIKLKLHKVQKRVGEAYGAKLHFTQSLVDAIGARCTEVETGARNADHIISRTLLPELASRFLQRMSEGQPIRNVEVGVAADGTFSYVISGA